MYLFIAGCLKSLCPVLAVSRIFQVMLDPYKNLMNRLTIIPFYSIATMPCYALLSNQKRHILIQPIPHPPLKPLNGVIQHENMQSICKAQRRAMLESKKMPQACRKASKSRKSRALSMKLLGKLEPPSQKQK
jgi:hypothetical protein